MLPRMTITPAAVQTFLLGTGTFALAALLILLAAPTETLACHKGTPHGQDTNCGGPPPPPPAASRTCKDLFGLLGPEDTECTCRFSENVVSTGGPGFSYEIQQQDDCTTYVELDLSNLNPDPDLLTSDIGAIVWIGNGHTLTVGPGFTGGSVLSTIAPVNFPGEPVEMVHIFDTVIELNGTRCTDPVEAAISWDGHGVMRRGSAKSVHITAATNADNVCHAIKISDFEGGPGFSPNSVGTSTIDPNTFTETGIWFSDTTFSVTGRNTIHAPISLGGATAIKFENISDPNVAHPSQGVARTDSNTINGNFDVGIEFDVSGEVAASTKDRLTAVAGGTGIKCINNDDVLKLKRTIITGYMPDVDC